MEAGSDPGSSQGSQTQRLEALEREGRFPELAVELQGALQRAEGAERAALLARLGETRLRMDDIAHALHAFRESLELDPKQPTSRRWLEVLLAEPEQALEAADILEPLYEREFRTVPHAASMLLAILELRGNRAPDNDERIATWVQLGAIYDVAAVPPERAREIAHRFLARTAVEWPGGVAKWIDRLFSHTSEPNERLSALLGALGQPVTDPQTLSELGLAAGHTLEQLQRTDEARVLYERALLADPSSPEVLDRLDVLAEAAAEAPELRLARYRMAIDRTEDVERRAALRVAAALIQKNALHEPAEAGENLRLALAENPGLFRAHVVLVEVYDLLGDDEALEREIDRGLTIFEGAERRQILLRLGDVLSARGRAQEAVERTRSLLEEPDLDEPTLDFFERLADDTGDVETWRKVHERRISLAGEGFVRARALENYAEFLVERAKDSAGAAACFKQAAQILCEGSEDFAEPERLLERALEVMPNDAESARGLLELCARGADWTKVPNACRVLLDALPDAVDAVAVVLSFEPRAAQTGGVDEFASMVDDVVSRLPDERVAETRELAAAKARVLGSAGRFDEAARVYQALIESFGDEPDIRAYVALLESSPDSDWRHQKRAWLFEWRVERAEDPVSVLTYWASVEEQEFSNIESAVALLERAVKLDAGRRAVFQDMARLKLLTGDAVGALAALGKVRELSTNGDASRVELVMAELLIERLDQPADALPLLESALLAKSPEPRARELALALSQNPATRLVAAELLERVARGGEPAAERAALLQLLDVTEVASQAADSAEELRPLRHRWFERLVGLAEGDGALALYERAAAEFPTDAAIWQAVESGSVRAQKPEVALRAYEGALARTQDVELAEQLGRRLIAFSSEYVGNPAALAGPLERLLAVAPGARWAFDRVKLSLTNEGRWDTLFRLYERVISAVTDEVERALLLDEAAVVARDLASDTERAMSYWEQFFALRPEDARVDLALERLYERHKKLDRLIEHLKRREPKLDATDLVRSRERITALWLELGDGREALRTVESLPKAAAQNDATLALLERIFRLEAAGDAEAIETQQKVARHAARLLKSRYAALERPANVADVIVVELTAPVDVKERIALLTQLAELRRTLADEAAEFESLGELMLLEPSQVAHRSRLAELSERLGQRKRLSELIVLTAERVSGSALFGELLGDAAQIRLEIGERDAAVELYARVLDECADDSLRLDAARRLSKLLLEAGRPEERCGVLERQAELSRDADEWRAALVEAARVALEELRDPERAAKNFRLLLGRHPEDIGLVDGLLRALRVGARWDQVVPALEQRAKLQEEADSARRDLGEAARLRAEKLDDVTGAIDAWRSVRERFGTDEESFEQLAGLLLQAARFGELAELLLTEAQASQRPAPLYSRLAEVHKRYTGDLAAALTAYVKAGDLVAAAGLFSSQPELVPDDPSLALELGERLAAGGARDVAERVLVRQIDHYGPRRPREGAAVHLALAELLAGGGHGARAIQELASAATRYPESGAVLSALGELSFSQGDLDRAEQSYRALLMLLGRGREPGERGLRRAEVYLSLSQVAARRGDAERAEDHMGSAFEAALDSDEESLSLEAALRKASRKDLVERAVTARLERAREPAKVVTALRDLLEASAGSGAVEPDLAERALRLADRAARELEAAGGQPTDGFLALLAIFDRLGEKERALGVLTLLSARSDAPPEQAAYDLVIAKRLLEQPARQADAVKQLWSLVERDAAADEPYHLLREQLSDDASVNRLLAVVQKQLNDADAEDVERMPVLAERLGSALESLGRPREALAAYERLAENEERRGPVRAKLVQLHEQLGTEGREMGDAIEAWLESEPTSENAADLALRLAEIRKQAGDEAGLERALTRGFHLAPERIDLCEALVDRLTERGAYGRAVETLERALDRARDNVGLRRRLSDILIRAGEPERALVALDAALLARAPEGEVRRERARILESLNRSEEALAELDRALVVEGVGGEELLLAIERTGAYRESEKWALRAADLCSEAPQRPRAREMLEPWIARTPDSVALLTRVARLAALDRDYGVAIDAYRKLASLEQGPARRAAVLALARMAEAAGRPDDAIAEVEKATAEGLDSVELRRELGRLYARAGDKLKQARMLLDDARAAKAPTQAELYLKAAELFAAEKATDEALVALGELARAEPERLECALLAADVLVQAGRPEEARQGLSGLLTETERRRVKGHAKLLVKLAELALADDDLVAAYEPLAQAHQLDKSDTDAAFLLGMLAVDLDHHETAFAALRVFTSLKDKAVDTHSRKQLSRAYTQLGELELSKSQRTVAKRMLARAVETDPENKAAHRLLTELNAR